MGFWANLSTHWVDPQLTGLVLAGGLAFNPFCAMPSLDKVSVVSDAHSDAGLPNQDSVFATQSSGQALLAVFDGHGEYGDKVSQSLCTLVQTTTDRPDALTNIGDTVRELCQKIEMHALPDNWAASSGSTVSRRAAIRVAR